jgi:hypothetical protein
LYSKKSILTLLPFADTYVGFCGENKDQLTELTKATLKFIVALEEHHHLAQTGVPVVCTEIKSILELAASEIQVI